MGWVKGQSPPTTTHVGWVKGQCPPNTPLVTVTVPVFTTTTTTTTDDPLWVKGQCPATTVDSNPQCVEGHGPPTIVDPSPPHKRKGGSTTTPLRRSTRIRTLQLQSKSTATTSSPNTGPRPPRALGRACPRPPEPPPAHSALAPGGGPGSPGSNTGGAPVVLHCDRLTGPPEGTSSRGYPGRGLDGDLTPSSQAFPAAQVPGQRGDRRESRGRILGGG